MLPLVVWAVVKTKRNRIKHPTYAPLAGRPDPRAMGLGVVGAVWWSKVASKAELERHGYEPHRQEAFGELRMSLQAL